MIESIVDGCIFSDLDMVVISLQDYNRSTTIKAVGMHCIALESSQNSIKPFEQEPKPSGQKRCG